MNKPLRHIAIFCGLMMLALLLRGNWLQYVRADELNSNKHNERVKMERYAHPRGSIVADGQAITGSEETGGVRYKYKSSYKDGAMWSAVTGYSSQSYGSTQLESIYDSVLTGNDDRLFFRNTVDMITGKDQQGGQVITTLDAAAQKAAYEGLGDKKGAVAAIDPQTGAILALVSTPSYDPGTFAGSLNADAKAKVALDENTDKPLINKALRETYPPGSTFKVVTAAAALENGVISDVDAATDSPDPWPLPLSSTPLTNEHGGCENVSLREALRVSCNTVFGKLSDEVGNKKMIEQTDKFGFNKELYVPVRTVSSVFPEADRPQNAMAGIGQASNRATPLQMAMVAAAVANDGKVMQPYMVSELKAQNLDTIGDRTEPKELSRAMSADTAKKLQSMMETVVKDGTGTKAQIDGVTVGGKTGTAQHGVDNSEKPYAWFISYAMTDSGSPVAVAVVVEDGAADRGDISGGGLAAPIAKAVMQAVLDKK